jgi:ribosome biogenesis GTPase A
MSVSKLTDSIGEQLERWNNNVPAWNVADVCRKRINQFFQRTETTRKRFSAPLIVAMLGGTGTGKSTLLNALVGEKAVQEGQIRPTTRKVSLVCHQDAQPATWNIDLTDIDLVKRKCSALEQLALLDCPDPDTTESEEERQSNLAQLRRVIPLCDILIVAATQQKYRSKKVLDELADAAPGVRLVFVQTRADKDVDIREDWREHLKEDYDTGQMFFVDSIHPELGKDSIDGLNALKQLLSQDLNCEAALKIRQANYVGLAEEAVQDCRDEIQENWNPIEKLREKISTERRKFGRQLSEKMRDELIRDKQIWESQLIGRIASQWAYSPFSLLLRLYQGVGTIMSGVLLARGFASPARLAVWGAFEGVRSIKKWSQTKKITSKETGTYTSVESLLSGEDENSLRTSSITLAGFTAEAGLPSKCCETDFVLNESRQVASYFITELSKEIDRICEVLATRKNRWRTRFFYEFLFTGMLFFILFRPAKNFFYDSIMNPSVEIYGIEKYLVFVFWLIIWGALLLGMFTWMLRRGLTKEISNSATHWETLSSLNMLFGNIEKDTNNVINFKNELETIQRHLDSISQQADKLDRRLGKKKPRSVGM